MSTSPSIHLGRTSARSSAPSASPPASEPPTERELVARAERRATLALFGGILALATVGVLVAVIANSAMGHRHHAWMMSASASAGVAPPSAQTVVAAAKPVSLSIVPGGKLGPKGERYDAFTKTNFAVKVGQPLKLTIDNRDDVIHSITSTAAGVGIAVMPGKHIYTLIVRKAGRFKWICAYPCDPYSMDAVGYMQGYITAT